jgi:Ca2+-binding RTX toxin-like protein
LSGDEGNDKVFGGDSSDDIIGGEGSDTLNGGNDIDRISHCEEHSRASDGAKDIINCAGGEGDEAWINESVDDDEVTNCETVHSDLDD